MFLFIQETFDERNIFRRSWSPEPEMPLLQPQTNINNGLGIPAGNGTFRSVFHDLP